MVPRRVYVNLAAFALLFGLLSVWAVTNVVRPAFLRSSYRVDAEFVQASGLRPGVEVTLRGVRVGQVTSVTATAGKADVALAIDDGVALPDGSGAAVRRRSAVGEPYVAIDPPADWHDGGPTMPTSGHRIPLSSTTTPLAYGELFSSADSLLKAVDPADVATITHELAAALRGRGDELATIVRDGSQVASTLAQGEGDLRQLGEHLTALTRTLADKSSTIAQSTEDLGSIVQVVASDADAVGEILDDAPKVSQQIDAILRASYQQLVCGADASAAITGTLGNEHTVTKIAELLHAAETASVAIPKAVYSGPDGRYLSGTFGFAPGELDAYPTFPEFATPPPMPTCTGSAPPIDQAAGSAAAEVGQTSPPETTGSRAVDASQAAPPAQRPGLVGRRDGTGPAALVALALCLAVAAGLGLAVRTRRSTGPFRDPQPLESMGET